MNLNNYLAKPDKTIHQHNQDLLECLSQLIDLGYITEKRTIQLTTDACQFHDIGKVNPQFQIRVKSTEKKIRFNPKTEVSHNVLSLFFVDQNNYEEIIDYYIVQNAISSHHNYCNVSETLEKEQELIQTLLEDFETFPIFARKFLKQLKKIRADKTAILVAGLLQKCDHCASGGFQAEYPNNFLKSAMDNLLDKWRRDNQKKDTFPDWNDLQKFCMNHSDENMIAIASTGMGKTEAALHWLGNEKGFFVLPLRTAINAMFDRIRIDILENENIKERLALLHSESREYLMDTTDMKLDDIRDFHDSARQFTMPLTITTMDQLFDFVFRYNCYEIKLATLSYSKIIIDEIQMYNAELLAYLIYGLEQIVEMGGKVAIITATLAPFIEEKLHRKIPFQKECFISKLERHNVQVLDKQINSEDVLQQFQQNKECSSRNKILVICNTIKKAQQIYKELEARIPKEELHMLHSRYIRKEREKLEYDIKQFAGSKKKLGEAQNGIWISTSLVEASLDLDFDYLFTELQDLNSLFQRMGRCNRLGLKPIDKVNCYVYLQIDSALFSCKFVDRKIYELSKEQLMKFSESCNGTLMTEERKLEMLSVFTTDNLTDCDYLMEYNEVYRGLESLRKNISGDKPELRHILSEDIIPYCVYEQHQEEIRAAEQALKYGQGEKALKYIHEIKKYTVPVPKYVYHNYLKKIRYGDALPWQPVQISDYVKIPIIGCTYTKLGFESLEDKTVNDAMIW